MTRTEVIELLKENADLKYKNFSEKLNSSSKSIIGVRYPVMRKLAKKLAKENYGEFLDGFKGEYLEEYIMYSFILDYSKADFQTKLLYFNKIVPFIGDWASCDTLCSSFKCAREYSEIMWKTLDVYLKSEKEFEQRIVAVMYLNYFLNDEYIDRVLGNLCLLKCDAYYTKMGVAWCLAESYAKYPEKTFEVLKKHLFEKDIERKTVRKIKESFKIDETGKRKILEILKKTLDK